MPSSPSSEIHNLTNSLVDLSENATESFREIFGISAQLNNLLSDTNGILDRIANRTASIAKLNTQIIKSKTETLSLDSSISSLQQKMTKHEQQISNIVAGRISSIKNLSAEIAEIQRKAEAGKLSLSAELIMQKKKAELLSKEQSLTDYLNRNYSHINIQNIKTLSALKHNREISKQITHALERDKETAMQYNKNLGKRTQLMEVVEKLAMGISKIPLIGNSISPGKIVESFASAYDKKGSLLSGIGTGIKSIGSEIMSVLRSPIASGLIVVQAFKELIKLTIGWDKHLTETANNLALSKEATQAIYRNFGSISTITKNYTDNLDNAFLSMGNHTKALKELNQLFGTNTFYTNKTLQNQIFLTKQMGMSADEAVNIQRLSLTNNSTAETTLKTILKQNNGILSYRKVISDVVKINGQLVAQYKNSPELLAKAVVEATKLGITLDQAKKASESLLNFQGSIESELEAELLTGKAINLEKARALSLDGQSAEAAKEMLRQVGSLQNYSRLNVIQQNSLAKAIGMSSDELTNALREQKLYNSLGIENKAALQEQYNLLVKNNDQLGIAKLQESLRNKENGDMVLKQISQVSLQQRFQESVEKVKELFVNIVTGPLMGMLSNISKLAADHLPKIITGAQKLYQTFSHIVPVVKAIFAPVVGIAQTLMGIVELLGGDFKAGIKDLGIGIGYMANPLIGAGMDYFARSVDDAVISPDGGIVISTPKGMIVPDKKDTLIASTNPEGLLKGNSGGNNIEMMQILSEIRDSIKKGGNVYMDSIRVGTTQGMSYSAYA